MTWNALLKLHGSTLPADAQTVAYRAQEAISRPYSVEAEFYSEDTGFDVSRCLRNRLLLEVINERGQKRLFDGIVDQAAFVRVTGDRFYYRVRLRPRLASLEHRVDSRIFQDLSILGVLQTLFNEAGFGEQVAWVLSGTYGPREFLVQYRESQLNFISRILEDNGLFYFFSHSTEGHTLILGDSPDAFSPRDDSPDVHFSLAQGMLMDGEPLEKLKRRRSLRTTSVHLRDYDFEKPRVLPEAVQPGEDAWPAPYYEYPAGFLTSDDGTQKAGRRLSELRRDADVCEGHSQAIGLRCGVPFTIDGAIEPCLNGTFVVTELVSEGRQNPESEQDNFACHNAFKAIPAGAPFAPARTAHRPRIRGVQPAIVTGDGTHEQAIYVDKYGRIKVRFYWDRVNQQNETSSCWMRVSQLIMGGTMVHPRVGWEVSVAFLEGDPDRPFVLGRVYNGEKPAPYGLPGAKASGSLKSMSSPGAGGHNEIKMSDTGGSQGFGIHAQKDLNITTNNNSDENVGVDETHNVTVNMSTSVGADETIKVGANQSLDVGAVLSRKIGGAQSITVGGNDTSNAISNFVEKISGSRSYSVGGNQTTICNGIEQTVTGDFTRKVGSVQLTGSVASISDNVLGSSSSKVGAVMVHLVNGSHGETVGSNKSQTSLAAELHLSSAGYSSECKASVTTLVGGLHYQKISGDYVLKAPLVTLVGAVGILKGGSSQLKLGGGPVVIKGSKLTFSGAMLIKMGASLKLGSG